MMETEKSLLLPDAQSMRTGQLFVWQRAVAWLVWLASPACRGRGRSTIAVTESFLAPKADFFENSCDKSAFSGFCQMKTSIKRRFRQT